MRVYVLTMGRGLYYASRNYEDAEYEKQFAEEETFQGRKLGIKEHEIDIDENEPDKEWSLNGAKVTTEEILSLL